MAQVPQELKDQISELLLKYGLLKFGEFTLKSGIKSPMYVDLRQVQSFPDLFKLVTKAYCTLIEGMPMDVIVSGIPEGGTSLATAVGYESGRRLVQPRKVIKDHGDIKSIEGVFEAGEKVMVIDDLITKGDSKLIALKQFEDNGLVVTNFYVLIDREQGGFEAMKARGLEIETVMKISEVVEYGKAKQLISDEQARTVLEFIKNN